MASLMHAPIAASILTGTTTQKVSFPAVDETDGDTLETGIGGWTVKSVRAGTVTTWTTPTVNEVSGMTGIYELTLDEDTTISAGEQTEQMLITLTASGIRDVVISVEIQDDMATAVDIGALGAGSGGSVNIEATEDNTGGAIDPSSAVFVGSVQSGTFASTESEDGTLHDIDDTANDIDIVYGFDVSGSRVGTEVSFAGFVQGNGDEMKIKVYDHVGADWESIGTITGQSGTTNVSIDMPLLLKHTGTGAELGKVYIRFETDSTTPSNLSVDKLLVSAVNNSLSVGYALGSIWVDGSASNTNTEDFVDGVADKPVSTWAAALTLSSSLGIKRFQIAGGTTITLSGNSDNYVLEGRNWTLALGTQSIDGAYFEGATSVTGTGEATTTQPTFVDCLFGAATVPPAILIRCGIGLASGTFSAAVDAGEYVFEDCYSAVPGSGSPAFDFSPVNAATGINNRRWSGGATYTLDSNCTLSHEVLSGGATTITTGGGSAEVRGICRALTLTMSAAETIQFVGVTGPVTISGTTTGTVNLFGVFGTITDTSVTATVNTDQQGVNVTSISGDTAAADALETMLDGTGGNTLSLGQLNITTSGNDDGILVDASSGTGDGINVTGGSEGAVIAGGTSFGLSVTATNQDAVQLTTSNAGSYPLDLVNTADSNDGLRGSIFGTVDTVTDVTNNVNCVLANTTHGGSSMVITANRINVTPSGANEGLHINGSSSTVTNGIVYVQGSASAPAVEFDGGGSKSGLVLIGGSSSTTAFPFSLSANQDDISINLANNAGTNGEGDVDGTFIRLVDDIWDETLKKSTHNVANSSGRILRLLSLASGTYDGHIVDQGTAQAGGASTIQIRAAYAGTISQGSLVMIEEGTGAGQVREVDSYDDPTNTITIVGTWDTNPDATSDYVVIPFAMMTTTTTTGDGNLTHIMGTALAETTAGNIAANFDNFYDNADAITTKVVDDVGSAASAPTAAAIADAVWDEDIIAAHNTADTAGAILGDWDDGGRLDLILDELTTQGDTNETLITTVDTVVDTILVDTNEIQTDLVDGGRIDLILDELTTQGDTNETKIDTVDTVVDSILVDTGTTLDAHLTDIKGTGFVKDTHSLTNIEGYADLIDDGTSGLAKIATDVAAILVDSNELQTDWVDGGRLDTILDSINAGATAAFQKNAAKANYGFTMFNSGSPTAGLTVTCERSLDGAAFAACANTPATEIGNGVYEIDLDAADLNGDTVIFKATATGADATFHYIYPV